MSLKESSMKSASSGKHDVKDSSGSLVLINAVASGDSVASMRSAIPTQKEDTPVIKLVCDGRELKIDEELVHTGLSAISVKYDNTLECISSSRALFSSSDIGRTGIMKHRNSFRNLHRPDLKRVPCLRKMSPSELESLFKGGTASQTNQCHKTSQVQDREQEKREAAELDESAYEDDRSDYSVKAIKTCPNNLCFEEECRSEMDGATRASLTPIPELRAPDVPPAMRLHVSRARVLTTVLANFNDESEAGDHSGDTAHSSANGVNIECECGRNCADDYAELHVILPPRREDDAFHSTSEARQSRNIS